MKVLMATDGSPEATLALQTANRFLNSVDRDFDLLCVAPKVRAKDGVPAGGNGYEKRILGEITQMLEQARAHLPSNAGVIRLLARMGSPAGVIVARTDDYDLTVIGPRGRGTPGEGGLGPVASRVVEHAQTPVLVARQLRSPESLRVLIAVDGSSASLRAVETLRSLFDLSSAEVCLMYVAETPWIEFGLEEDWITYSEEDKEQSESGVLEKELIREGDAIMERARALLRPLALSISTRTEEGNPANEILSEAERGQYDLVVVGATGSRDLKHRMLGSVSSKIAWDASCSVLMAREPE